MPCSRLRTIDDKSYLAYAQNSAAHLHLRAGASTGAPLRFRSADRGLCDASRE